MKLFTGWLWRRGWSLLAGGAQAQMLGPTGRSALRPTRRRPTSAAPYARDAARKPRCRGTVRPGLLPSTEVYTVLRENGFSPLGIPRQRGFVYTIAVIDRGGEDGRLVIDARNGRIIRFMPANRMGDNFDDALTIIYGPPGPPPPHRGPGEPRPPRPQVATRTRAAAVPVPKARPASRQQSRSPQPSAAPAQQRRRAGQAAGAAPPTSGTAATKPNRHRRSAARGMPKVQGLD